MSYYEFEKAEMKGFFDGYEAALRDVLEQLNNNPDISPLGHAQYITNNLLDAIQRDRRTL